MEKKATLPKVAMHIERGFLIVSIQIELYDEVITNIQKDILEKVFSAGLKGIIIDVSMVDLMDSYIGSAISDLAKMLNLLGAKTVLTGLKPEITAALVDLEFNFTDIDFALNIEEGFSILEPEVIPEEAETMEELDEEKDDRGEDDSEGIESESDEDKKGSNIIKDEDEEEQEG